MIRADLHIHTRFSPDGEFTPAEIISKCKDASLSVISITDHNTVKAVSEAIEIGATHGIRVIPGIELDCSFDETDLHLLGYGIDWQNPVFDSIESDVSGLMMKSFDQMILNLNTLGIQVQSEEVISKSEGGLPTAELIAEVLLDNPKYGGISLLDAYRKGGARSDMPFINFYLDFFAQGKPAYVKVQFMAFHEAVRIIREAGGITVIAHPGHNFRGKENKVLELIKSGAEGIEVFNNYHNRDQIDHFHEMALQNRMLITCGSDFHGKTKPLIEPGIYNIISDEEPLLQGYLEHFTKKIPAF